MRPIPGILAAALLCCLWVFTGPALAQSTMVCNETKEPLYIAVRHNAPSLFTANSRTEGWYRLPVRGILRSCSSFNRFARDHYIVTGVLRDGKVVPVKFALRNYDIRKTVNFCVPLSPSSFEYKSADLSDKSCGTGYQLARASAGVQGGKNDVDLDFSGSITVPNGKTTSKSTETKESKAAKALAGALLGEGLLKDIRALQQEPYVATSRATHKDSVQNWTNYLENKVLKTSIGRGSSEGNVSHTWLQPEGRRVRIGTTDASAGERYSEAFFQDHVNLSPPLFGQTNRWSVEIIWDVPMICFYGDEDAKPRPDSIACHQLQWKSDKNHRFGGIVSLYGYWIFRVKAGKIKPDVPLGFPYPIPDAIADSR